MRKHDAALAKRLSDGIASFQLAPMPGIALDVRRSCLLEQLVESHRRIKYISVICERGGSASNADPRHVGFDPLRAAVYLKRQGQLDESFWMVFLSVYFGKHRVDEWRLLADIYGGARDGIMWTWNNLLSDNARFQECVRNYVRERERGSVRRFRFGNHRKYETLCPDSSRGFLSAVESYIKWAGRDVGHSSFASRFGDLAPDQLFEALYSSMGTVISFGRTAKFDYLTMIGKLGLLNIAPGHPYLRDSTGPIRGARLLFGVNDITSLESFSTALGEHLGLHMQAIEDALCNWQKSPSKFAPFRG